MGTKHIKWYVNIKKWIPTKDQWLKLTSSIPDEEVFRINKFVYQEDAKSSLIGQVLIRKFLSNVLNRPSNEIKIIRTELGRPKVCDTYRDYLKEKNCWPNLIDFNVSHSGDFCVLAGFWDFDKLYSNERQINSTVGVDVTKIIEKKTKQELERFLQLMSRREFLPSEWETVTSVDSDRQKCINFTRLWCLKECFIKSIGLGLKFELRRIEFKFSDNYKYNISTQLLKNNLLTDTRVILDGLVAKNWQFQETALDDEHLVAIGYNSSLESFQIDDGTFEEISVDCIRDSLTLMDNINEQNWFKFVQKGTKVCSS